jgi:MinD-like ATPase involved in chromosome partitioning or flagellar assembly
MIVCWSVKGGSGTTVVASTIALMRAAESQRGALLVDLAGDVPAVLGLAESSGPGINDWFANCDHGSRMTLQSIAIQATANLQIIARGSKQLDAKENRNFSELCAALKTFDLPIIVDAGCGLPSPDLLAQASSSLLVTRPCYLSLRRAAQLSVSPTGIVLINETGRALGKHDVEAVIGAPVVAEISFDAAIARAVDAGLLASRIPTIMSKQLAVVA